MKTLIALMVSLMGFSVSANAQIDSAYSVVYLEVQADPAARAATVAALDAYETALKEQEGFTGLARFEQVGRAGHLVFVEYWRNQAALEGQDPAPQQQLAAALEPLRTSNIDRRPYKAANVEVSRRNGSNPVYVISHVDAAPGGDMAAILQAWIHGSRAEGGNLSFDVLQHAVRGNHYTVIEEWENSAALEAHVLAPHTRAFRDAFGPLAGSPLDERIFTALQAR